MLSFSLIAYFPTSLVRAPPTVRWAHAGDPADMVFVMCAGGYFVNLNHLPTWVGALRYTSFWYYAMGLFVAFALPTNEDRAAFAANQTLSKYSFSRWSWDGRAEYDVAALCGFVLVQRVLSFVALKCSKKLQFR